ncbi:MAG: Lar family restriction alleviation protein [Synergistaceae bacterium]|nr:Lar family restriction alleviation protein [Synergistaceae bacterium]
MNIELIECPCCGGQGEVKTYSGKFYVECQVCGFSTARPEYQVDGLPREQIIRHWNNRPAPFGKKFPEIKLEYCPICGNRHKIFISSNLDFTYHVFCDFCYATSGRYDTKAEAIAAWNRRD